MNGCEFNVMLKDVRLAHPFLIDWHDGGIFQPNLLSLLFLLPQHKIRDAKVPTPIKTSIAAAFYRFNR